MRLLLSILLIFIVAFECAGQLNLKKHEIYDSWIKQKSVNTNDSIKTLIFTVDKELNKTANQFLSKLKSEGIDSILIYGKTHSGSFSTDTCLNIPVLEELYFLCKDKNSLYITKMIGHCIYTSSITSTDVFSYWEKHANDMKHEVIMPIILFAEKDSSGKIIHTVLSVSHDTHFQIIFITKKKYSLFKFQQADIESGLFLEENLKLKSITLWSKLEKLTDVNFR